MALPLTQHEKTDRRIRRTRRQLSEAMLALLVERDYESITVQEITTRADLNRATFYHHFNHKDELLAAALEDRFDELVASFGDITASHALWQSNMPEILTFRHVAEHAALYKVLLSDRGMSQIIYRIIDYIARFAKDKALVSKALYKSASVPEPLIAQHMAGALFALLSWWLAHDMPYTPEEMAEMSHLLCTEGITSIYDPAVAATYPAPQMATEVKRR